MTEAGAEDANSLLSGMAEMETFEDFFAWCEERGLRRSRDIARAFGRTPQTVDNWRKGRSRKGGFPAHLRLSCIGYEAVRRETGLLNPIDGPITHTMFELWQMYHGLETLEAVANVFGLTRQAVHNWHVRKKFPQWLNLACHGYAHLHANRTPAGRLSRRQARFALDSAENGAGQSCGIERSRP